VVKRGPGHVDQVNGEQLDDEEVIIHPTHPTSKLVVLQPNTGVGFAVILDDIVWRLKKF
jgi:hypothetical protein